VFALRSMTRRLGLKFLNLDGARSKARQLVRLHRPAIEAVADALVLSTSVFAQDAPVTDCDTYAANNVAAPRKIPQ
jgi:hypothetical protein